LKRCSEGAPVRFFLGAEIPDGVFAYKSGHSVLPLTELENLLVVGACAGNTSWHHMICRADLYAPHLSNYAGAAGGRTFPSAAGFHTSMLFFTDDNGVYVLDNRDAPAFAERSVDGHLEIVDLIDDVRKRIRKIQDGRLKLPPAVPHIEAHNTWVVNHPGTTLVIPVADLAQHMILGLCYMLQNNYVLYDDINRCPIPGIERFGSIVDTENVWPLSFVEQLTMGEAAAELSTSCFAGALMLQAMGLGGWMFDGVSPHSLLGASGDPDVPGLGFRFDVDERWSLPNVTGLEGVMEGFCPPHYPDMRAAVEAVYRRKFGEGGPFSPLTPGPWKDSGKVRSSAQRHSEAFLECVSIQAQYVYDTFGKFPGTVSSIFAMPYLQAHHLDTGFYDTFYKPGSYLDTHSAHIERWHGQV